MQANSNVDFCQHGLLCSMLVLLVWYLLILWTISPRGGPATNALFVISELLLSANKQTVLIYFLMLEGKKEVAELEPKLEGNSPLKSHCHD